MGFALMGVAGSLVAVGYLIAGTIPESDGASTAVGASYVILAVGVYLSLLAIGIVVAKNRSLSGRWRWHPLGLVAAQFPIFIVAGAIGDGVGSEPHRWTRPRSHGRRLGTARLRPDQDRGDWNRRLPKQHRAARYCTGYVGGRLSGTDWCRGWNSRMRRATSSGSQEARHPGLAECVQRHPRLAASRMGDGPGVSPPMAHDAIRARLRAKGGSDLVHQSHPGG